jgi:trigger factor
MKVEVKKTRECERALKITMPPDPVKQKVTQLYSDYQKRVQIDGFRKGKVPMNIIEQRYEKTIQEEAVSVTVREAFIQAVKDENLSPITQGFIEETKFDDNEGLSFKVTFEVAPEIEVKNYEGIEIEKPSALVSKEDIEAALSKLQESKATYVPVLTRGAQQGDMLVVDCEVLREERGVLRKEKTPNYTVVLGSPGIPKEITQGLLNSVVSDRRKISFRYPADFEDANLRGQLIEHEFVVREIKEKRLSDVDDAFAKELGFESLAKLREEIKREIGKDKERGAKAKVENQIINMLVKENVFESPRSIVAAYLQPLIKRMGEELDDATRKELEEIAIWRAKREILLDRIAELQEIEMSDAEIKSKLMELDEYKQAGHERFVRQLKERGTYDFIVEEFRRGKTIEFLVSKSKEVG